MGKSGGKRARQPMPPRPAPTLGERIKRRIDIGYSMKVGNGKGEYPPFKIIAWEDRAAFKQYVFDCIDEVCEATAPRDTTEAGNG